MREARDGQRLQPHATGTAEGSEKDTVAAEDHISDSGNALDLKRHSGLEGANVAGVNAEKFTGAEVLDDEFAGELEPCGTLAADLLQAEAIAAKDTRTERLLEADAELDTGGRAEEAVTVNEVLVARADLDRNDVARNACGERNLAGCAHGAVFRHKERAAAGNTLDRSEEATAASMLSVGGHLNRSSHPGELAGLRDYGVVGTEGELEDGHSGAENAILQDFLLMTRRLEYTATGFLSIRLQGQFVRTRSAKTDINIDLCVLRIGGALIVYLIVGFECARAAQLFRGHSPNLLPYLGDYLL